MSVSDFRLWIIFASLFYVIDGLSVADFTTPCKRSDPNLDKCAINSANELRPKLKRGIKPLRIPPLDPMIIPKIKIVSGGGGPVTLESTFNDVHVEGISAYEMKNVHIDLDKREITAEVFVPALSTSGKYNVNGKIIALPITGNGTSHSKYIGVSAFLKLKLKPETKNGKEYWILDKSDFDINVEHAQIRLDNLFNGNKQLGDTMNSFINENWQTVFQELKPTIRDAINTLIADLVSKVFKAFPVEELFPQ